MAKTSGGGGRLSRIGTSVDVVGRGGGIDFGSGTVTGGAGRGNVRVRMDDGRTFAVPRNSLAPRGSSQLANESNRALRRTMFANGASQSEVQSAMRRNTAKILRRRNP